MILEIWWLLEKYWYHPRRALVLSKTNTAVISILLLTPLRIIKVALILCRTHTSRPKEPGKVMAGSSKAGQKDKRYSSLQTGSRCISSRNSPSSPPVLPLNILIQQNQNQKQAITPDRSLCFRICRPSFLHGVILRPSPGPKTTRTRGTFERCHSQNLLNLCRLARCNSGGIFTTLGFMRETYLPALFILLQVFSKNWNPNV